MSDITKQALANSLRHLLEKKSLSKITIKDIVEDCGVNRQTFYYHFQDVYDLVDWIFHNDFDRVLAEHKDYHTWQQGCRQVLDYMLQNRILVLNAAHSVNRIQLEEHMKSWIRPILADIIEDLSSDIPISDEDKDFVTTIYLLMLSGLFMEWIGKDMPRDQLKNLDKLFCCMDGSIRHMLMNFVSKEKN
jgi:probable dihydroxyacetone kinase regulator